MNKKMKALKKKYGALKAQASKHKLGLINTVLILFVLIRLELISAKLDMIIEGLGNMFINMFVNLMMFGEKLTALLERFSGDGA